MITPVETTMTRCAIAHGISTLVMASYGTSGEKADADALFAQMMIPHHE